MAVEGKPKIVHQEGVTGTYLRDDASKSHIEVQQLPGGRIEFHVVAFWGEWPNSGETGGVITLSGGTAIFTDLGDGGERSKCALTLRFRMNTVNVDQDGECDFGYAVTAAGNYRRTSLCAAPNRD